MPLDWSRIGTGDREPLLRPRDIFAALPNRPWPYLRQEQGEVLETWFGRRDDRDLVIKQNTGGGKTVVGLLIAQSTLNEGVGKAIYLAPDTYLAKWVREEASRLGLATAEDPNDPAFRAQEAILVTTFQKLINGQSEPSDARRCGDHNTVKQFGGSDDHLHPCSRSALAVLGPRRAWPAASWTLPADRTRARSWRAGSRRASSCAGRTDPRGDAIGL
jgi:hypothetical protein